MIKNIYWTQSSVNAVNSILKTINQTNLTSPLGQIINYYLTKYDEKNKIGKILSLESIKINQTRDFILITHLCEICLENQDRNNILTLDEKLVYTTIGDIIYEVVYDKFIYGNWELNYEEMYLVNLLKDIFELDNVDIVKSCYFLTKTMIRTFNDTLYNSCEKCEIMFLNKPALKYHLTFHQTYLESPFDLPSLSLRAQDLDISLITIKQKRDILRILETKRTIYLRFLLVLINQMKREKSIINSLWFLRKTHLKTEEEMELFFSDPVIETILYLTSNIIY